MILNDVSDAQDLKKKLPDIKKTVKEELRRCSKDFTIVDDFITVTDFSVKFSVQGTHGNVDVDLLPTFTFEGTYSKYETLNTYYGCLGPVSDVERLYRKNRWHMSDWLLKVRKITKANSM